MLRPGPGTFESGDDTLTQRRRLLDIAYAAVAVAVIVALLAWSATTDDCDVVVDTMLTPEEPCYDEFFGGDR